MVGTWREWLFFFFNDTATTEIYTLSLHDALPILPDAPAPAPGPAPAARRPPNDGTPCCRVARSTPARTRRDRKSTRLNSSHSQISYAVFCLKKKQHTTTTTHQRRALPAVTATEDL